jgi:mRNA-degrading endonuclease toxin of MazEF toxin-antitoxin module
VNSSSASFPRRGEVYWLDYAPATGQEMTGMHPCVIGKLTPARLAELDSALTCSVGLLS